MKDVRFEDCPYCRHVGSVEVIDNILLLQFRRKCFDCGWTDGLDYYEFPTGEIALLTEFEFNEIKKYSSFKDEDVEGTQEIDSDVEEGWIQKRSSGTTEGDEEVQIDVY